MMISADSTRQPPITVFIVIGSDRNSTDARTPVRGSVVDASDAVEGPTRSRPSKKVHAL